MKLQIVHGEVTVDAEDLAPLLGLEAAEVPALMRQGEITGLVEEGQEEDAGRFRVTFRYRGTRLRFTVDREGEVLSRSRVEASPRRRQGR